MFVYFAIGVLLGAATGVPIGIANVAILDAATRVGSRRAHGLALGGALADATHAGIAFVGVGPVITAVGGLGGALYAVTGVLVGTYALAVVRDARRDAARRAGWEPPVDADETADGARPGDRVVPGVLAGYLLTASNPAALAAWVAIAGSFFADATRPEGAVVATGIGIGSAAWFTFLARLGRRARGLGAERRRQLSFALGVVLLVIAVAALTRAALTWA